MIERTRYAHASRNIFHLNGDFLVAGMTAATIASWAALWAGARLSSAAAITGVSTAIGVLTFVPLYVLLHYLHTAAVPGKAPIGPRAWQGVPVTGAICIGILLGFHIAGQYVLIRLGMRPDYACLVAYMSGHASSHAAHVLLRATGISSGRGGRALQRNVPLHRAVGAAQPRGPGARMAISRASAKV